MRASKTVQEEIKAMAWRNTEIYKIFSCNFEAVNANCVVTVNGKMCHFQVATAEGAGTARSLTKRKRLDATESSVAEMSRDYGASATSLPSETPLALALT